MPEDIQMKNLTLNGHFKEKKKNLSKQVLEWIPFAQRKRRTLGKLG